jgi:crossover junction endonuclease MUS81
MKSGRRRIFIQLQTPNPLFERWIIEWLKEAEQKSTQNQHSLRKALQSIQRYPLPLSSGQDCQILEGFGQRICQMIDRKLEKHTREHGAIVETPIERNLKVLQHIQDMLRDEEAENRVNPPEKSMKFFPNNFEVLLLVDTQERIGFVLMFLKRVRVLIWSYISRKIKTTNENTLKDLEKYNVKFEVRRLSVGDFLWIARDEQGNELVLPYIVERKRMDDLGSSIRDGRFHEQKFRLKQCRLANVIYLIESYGKNQNVGLPVATLYQAATNTLVQSGFQVKFTENLAHTVMYLSVMTTFVKQLFQVDWKTTNCWPIVFIFIQNIPGQNSYK